MSNYHVSVLLQEAIEGLKVHPGGKYIDGTLGGGGYSIEIAKKGGNVLSFDVDEDAITFASEFIEEHNPELQSNIQIVKSNFRDIETVAQSQGFSPANGIVFDLGVSSHQFDEAQRGFSFRHDGMLDMRMDQRLERSALDLVNTLSRGELYAVFRGFGEERYAGRIADVIVQKRSEAKITTTRQLADIATEANPAWGQKIHPATRIFQALRIAVNDEFGALKEALDGSIHLLVPGGRLVVVTFHSLEEQIVKEYFVKFKKQNVGKIITKQPIEPSAEEIASNAKSRSAKLFIFEKL